MGSRITLGQVPLPMEEAMTCRVPCSLVLALCACSSAYADWSANDDLVANETLDGGVHEMSNPNAVVPQWSYGYRATLDGSGLNLFGGSANHFNAFGTGSATSFQGWSADAGRSPWVMAHIGSFSDQIFLGVDAVAPHEMAASPGESGSGTDFLVVRWTAPASGTYDVLSSHWRDLHTGSGNGQEAAVVAGGAVVWHEAFPGNGSAGLASPLRISLQAGQSIDFVLGSNGDVSGDTTGFGAQIAAATVPELSSALLLSVGGLAVLSMGGFRSRLRRPDRC